MKAQNSVESGSKVANDQVILKHNNWKFVYF